MTIFKVKKFVRAILLTNKVLKKQNKRERSKMGPYSINFQGFIPKVLVKLADKPFLIKSSFRGQLGKKVICL